MDDLDRAMFAGFESDPGESVLERIERTAGRKARVLLHDLPHDASPLLRMAGPLPNGDEAKDDNRYHIVGEIARGGVGIVHKARDKDLGRDVALKLLRAEHGNKPEVLARFVEEAQIGAQLQHPGIVPVYGLGLNGDGRPYFTMKLIKGRTLAALLKERENPSDDGRRFIEMFEQICHTISYAQARGVIHRDLKPSNVMIGAFGEVQVVDWGFGKVLGREDHPAARLAERTVIATVRSDTEGSRSLAGSVMGTPAYMPPEQALGHVDELDRQSDVFSLGAILCEILTGQPPYTGNPKDLLMLASQARLEDAHARLESCGAHAGLVELAKRCLEPLRGSRPEQAGVVAEAIETHLAAADERARGADLEAIKQQAEVKAQRRNAAWARRKRRRTRLVTAAILLATACGGGAFLWSEADRDRRVAAARSRVDAAMEQAAFLRGQHKWDEALASARRAHGIATTEADNELRQRTADLVRSTETGRKAHEQAQRRAAEAAAFIRDLEEIRLARGDDMNNRATDRAYAAAFRTRGLELSDSGCADGIRARFPAAVLDVAAALDEWAWLRRTKRRLSDTEWKPLIAVARALDPDPWRNGLRRASVSEDMDGLRHLASEAARQGLPLRTLDMLGVALGQGGDPEAAVALYRTVRHSHPADFWVNFHLAGFLMLQQRPGPAEAVRFSTAALALRPESVVAVQRLSEALGELGRHGEAITRLRDAIRGTPTSATLHVGLGAALSMVARFDEAVLADREAIGLDPDNLVAQNNLGYHLLEAGHLDAAENACRKAIRLAPQEVTPRLNLADVLRLKRQYVEAEAVSREAVHVDPQDPDAHGGLAAVLMEQGHPKKALAAIREAIRRAPGRSKFHYNLGVFLSMMGREKDAGRAWSTAIGLEPAVAEAFVGLSSVLRPRGEFKRAVTLCREAIRRKPWLPSAHQGLGLSLRGLGRLEKAEAAIREALRLSPNRATLWANLAAILTDRDRPREAVEECRKALRLDPALDLAQRNLGGALEKLGALEQAVEAYRKAAASERYAYSAYVRLGHTLAKLRRYKEAATAIRAAIRLKPEQALPQAKLAAILQRLNRPREAIEACQAALRLDPTYATAYRNMVKAYADLGEFDRAIQACRDAVRLDPIPVDYEQLGYLLATQENDMDGALAAYREAVRLAPKSGRIYMNMASVLMRMNNREGAIEACRRAITLDPRLARAHARLGWLLWRTGAYDEAEPALREAIRLDPKLIQTHRDLGNVLGDQGRHEAAVAAYREYLRRAPKRVDGHHNLGLALGRLGQVDDAIRSFREAIRLVPSGVAHTQLGFQLVKKDDIERALASFREAVRLAPGSIINQNNLTHAAHAFRLESKWLAIRDGDSIPRDPRDAAAFAWVAQLQARPTLSARLYEVAFGGGLKASELDHLNAACAAVLAAEKGRAEHWRNRALEWLRTRLGALSTRPLAARRKRIDWWRKDPDLGSVRTPEALAKLPEAERERWRKLWADVDALAKEEDR